MGRFAIGRIVQGLVVVFCVTVVVFVTTRLVGDPVKVMLPFESTPEQRAAFRHQIGFDRPILTQFREYIENLAQGDFGNSLLQDRPTIRIVLEHLPATFELVFAGIALAVLIAVPLGVIAALRPGGVVDRVSVFLSLIGLSVPQFFLGILLILFFAVELQWLPASGKGGLDHLILPALTLALPAVGRLAMIARSSMIDELGNAYVQTAKAKGIPHWRVVGIHALRNAFIPVLTLTGWELIRALAGYSVVVETVFAWPGVGYLAYQAIQDQDLFLLQTIVLVIAVLVVFVNVGIDILYRAVDPRIKLA
ncbi:MAG TPA: ABC transporter permease [Gaiella sp.]|jgi:peptide/nickel transport system permease protein|nr:ABC transporter permease [Gaiella sp.]